MLSCLYDYVYFVFFMSYHALGKKKKKENIRYEWRWDLGSLFGGGGKNVYSISIGIDLRILYHRL